MTSQTHLFEEEIWKEVPDYPGVMASSWGRVRLPPSEIIRPGHKIRRWQKPPTYGTLTTKGSYPLLVMYLVRWRKNVRVSQLVCSAFHGPRPFPGAMVLHIDEDSTNNHFTNLKWGTNKENMNFPGFLERCRTRPNRLRGGRIGTSKLTEADIVNIRNDPRTNPEVARAYGVDTSNIGLIRGRKSWAHVP